MTRKDARLVGYVRVSTREQGDTKLGLEAQRIAIDVESLRSGFEVVEVFEDVASGTKMNRPGLNAAMQACREGRADGIVVAKLDRLARSVVGFAHFIETAQSEGWTLVVIDLALDLSSASGRMVANVLAALAEWERDMISTRTKAALSAKKDRGEKLGPAWLLPEAVVLRISLQRELGSSLREIADMLNADRVPTAMGGKRWYASTVRHVLQREAAEVA